ncbi:lariat debranching enzyme [Emydomyces testavorans]|uniref:Lariat debranching enzyme n=1 Tax=Emydomyces testavorans TaxID=2070801 RepID=A0AAF0DEP6_9EURO|nr:lariat debranching enzyme [Emydomyces testavorans]
MALQLSTRLGLRLAVEGCGHGKLHDIYAQVQKAAEVKGWNGVDLLIIGGDFQAVRNSHDMACMAVPSKYKKIGDFQEYYSGARVAPYLTVFVGGNHEASNHLFELYYGGWVAPKIYYLGAANVIRCGPLRIAGMSGIWKGYDYRRQHFERLPYDFDAMRSIYHVREIDVRKLLQVRTQVDIGISHDWPQGIEWTGDYDDLFRRKPFFVEDAESGKLGSPAARYVLDRLRPAHWFSAHLHTKYVSKLEHTVYTAPRVVNTHQLNSPPQQSQARDPALNPEPEESLDGLIDEPVKEPDVVSSELETSPGTKSDKSHCPPQGDEQERLSAWKGFYEVASKREAEENAEFLKAADEFRRRVDAGEVEKPRSQIDYQVTWKKVVTDDGLSREVTDVIRTNTGSGESQMQGEGSSSAVKNADEIDIDIDSGSEVPEEPHDLADISSSEQKLTAKPEFAAAPDQTQVDGVSDELRSQLPASFQRPNNTESNAIVVEDFPEGITNKTTEFLALDKCEPRKHFLELLEVFPLSESDEGCDERPYQLRYDKEWLAITRVFAEEFEVGNKQAPIPPDKGTAFYKPKIIAAEAWVEEHLVKKGKMIVPQNFTITAPVYDPSVPVTIRQQPFEYVNPQTVQFCEMLGIENKFQLSEEKKREQEEAILQANERCGSENGSSRGQGGGFRGSWRGGRGNRGSRHAGGRGGRGWHGGRGRGRGGP